MGSKHASKQAGKPKRPLGQKWPVRTVVLYHRDLDGFAAAWAARRKFSQEGRPRIEFHDVNYREAMPHISSGSDLFILDFCYARAELEELRKRAVSIVVLDHHKSAAKELEGFPGAVVDIERAGCALSWEFFHGPQPMPKLLQHVADRDLWQFRIANTRTVCAALKSYAQQFAVWDVIVAEYERDPLPLLQAGATIQRYTQRLTDLLVEQVQQMDLAGERVPVCNVACPALISEAGQKLLECYPDARFSMTFAQRGDGAIVCNLRSRGDYDVARVAESLGGGGHGAAAGFVVAPGGEVPGLTLLGSART